MIAGPARLASPADQDRCAAMPSRHSYRHRFDPVPLPPEVLAGLVAVAEADGVAVHRVDGILEVTALAEAFAYAGGVFRADQGYQRELAGWTVRSGEPGPGGRWAGIRYESLSAEPLPSAGLVHHGTPLPDCAVLSVRVAAETLLVLTTAEDTPEAHLRTGEALERTWLTAVAAGLVGAVLTQPLQLSEVRHRLRQNLGLPGEPHLLLRVGYPAPPDIPVQGR